MTRVSAGKLVLRWVAGALVLLVSAEALVRWAGMVDFPLYDADAAVGYIPKANQSGSFLNRNDWTLNAQHMGSEAFVPSAAGNLLLLGDSVVWGGNTYKQSERLGPQLQSRSKGKVWPVSAGSWALQNELAYLNAHSDVVARVDTIAFLLNSGDLGPPSSWGCALSHPRERSPVALIYLAKKYVLKWPCEGTPPELQVAKRDPIVLLKTFLQAHADKRFMFFLYPDRDEAADPVLMQERLGPIASALADARGGGVEIIAIGRDPRWVGKPQHYKDGIHPTAEGIGVLAEIIANAVASRNKN